MKEFTSIFLSILLTLSVVAISNAQDTEGQRYVNIDGRWVLVGPDGQEVEIEYTHEVVTTGKWGKYVPVFNFRNAYIDARDNRKFQDIVCKLELGNKVIFRPYLDSGTGEIFQADNNHPGCSGWTDRNIFEEINKEEN